jgi:diaminohydroxyphosphoribosylaminopyrimidine deaminase/5-amino-6-(5-phosphoribosylamino)uracil reductase
VTVTLKLATSLDGRIATGTGESRWITGEAAREAVHRIRSQNDAVLIGIGTALADDPELTVRLPGYEGKQPARVVLDTHQRLSPDCKLARTARDIPTYVVTPGPPESALTKAGVRILITPGPDRPDPKAVVAELSGLGLNNLMIEGGGEVAASFLRAGVIDRIEWFRAPLILGGEGRPAIGALALEHLADAPRFKRIEVSSVGEDLWERYEAQ